MTVRIIRHTLSVHRGIVGRIAAAILVLAVAACVDVAVPGQGEPPKLFTLTPKSTYSADLPRAHWQLIVELPIMSESLNTSRIALRHSPVSLQYYKNARWTERTPVMVQTLLIESFENTGKIIAVARRATDLRADYILKTDVREFQVEYTDNGPPMVRVRLNAKLVKMPERTIIASHTVENTKVAANGEVISIILAFDAAFGKTLKSIVEWTLRTPGNV